MGFLWEFWCVFLWKFNWEFWWLFWWEFWWEFWWIPPTTSTKLCDTRSQWNIHTVSKAYTVVWVLIQSLMSFTAPEGRFLKSLPGNGLSYQSWGDLAIGFVQSHNCIFDLQQQLRSNTRDITRRISVLLFSLHLLLYLLHLLHPQYPLHLVHLIHRLELPHLLLLFWYQLRLPIIEIFSMAVLTAPPSSPLPPGLSCLLRPLYPLHLHAPVPPVPSAAPGSCTSCAF